MISKGCFVGIGSLGTITLQIAGISGGICGALLTAELISIPVTGAAYNGQAAASYADYWAGTPADPSRHNPSYNYFSTDDCTNFLSQAVIARGFPQTSPGLYTDLSRFFNNTSAQWAQNIPLQSVEQRQSSLTASLVVDFKNYSINNNHATAVGNFAYTVNGVIQHAPSFTPSNVVTGDPIYYDWTSDAQIDHAAIQVGSGVDPDSKYYGNLVDENTSNRTNAFWTLKPYYANWQQETVYYDHITG